MVHGIDRIQIQNQHGRLMCYIMLGKWDQIGSLFASTSDTQYIFHDKGISAVGVDAIADAFRAVGNDHFVFSHTPAIKKVDDRTIAATWMAMEFVVLDDVECMRSLERRVLRFDAEFVREGETWKYARLVQYYFMSTLPKQYIIQRSVGSKGDCPPQQDGATNVRDYLEIANLQGRWAQDRRRGAKEMFSRSEQAGLSIPTLNVAATGYEEVAAALDQLDQIEAKNGGAYLSVIMTASPVITVDEDGQSASGSWLAVTHDMKASAFGNDLADCPVVLVLGRYDNRFIKENGIWKFEQIYFYPVVTVDADRFDFTASKSSIFSLEDENWLYAPERQAESPAEDALEIEDYVAHWTAGLRYRSEAPFYYRYIARERPDLLCWTMMSRKEGERYRISRTMDRIHEEIFGMTDMFQSAQPKGSGFHCATTPVVELSKDGESATAVWLDYGWTLMAEAFGIQQPPYPVNPAIGRYEHEYVKIDGQWKLCKFKWFPLFRIHPWGFDYSQTLGWAGSDSEKRFPLPFMEYTYSPRRRDLSKPYVLEAPIISSPYEKQKGLVIGD